MNLDDSAVKTYGLYPDPDNLFFLQLLENAMQHAAFGPAAQTGADGMPVAESFG